jgi:hypothetical protein
MRRSIRSGLPSLVPVPTTWTPREALNSAAAQAPLRPPRFRTTARRSASPVYHVIPGAEPPAAGASANPLDIALVAMLGLIRPRIFEATDTDIARPAHRPRVVPHFAANYPNPHDPGAVLVNATRHETVPVRVDRACYPS